MAVKGLKKHGLSNMAGKLSKFMTLQHMEIKQLVDFSDDLRDGRFSCFVLCGWKGLLRMQSECFGLELGSAAEFLQLPEGRHSAVFYDANGRLVLRWRQRKNRPSGSYIIRQCDCNVDGEKYCLCCRMRVHVDGLRIGERLWPADYKPEQTLKVLRARMVVLGHQHHTIVTWKAFRAGRATHMAANGFGLSAILAAGDWASAAVFRYLREESADHEETLRQVLSKELEEPEEES